VGSNLPFNGDTSSTLVNVEGREREIGEPGLRIYTHQVAPGFFAALGARRLSGRDFTAADGPGSPRVALVSRRFAERALPGLDPLGRRLRGRGKNDPWVTIVGVVDEIRWGRLAPDPKSFPEDPDVYYPLAQGPVQDLAVAVRSALPAADLTAAVRRETAAVDRDMPAYALEPMADLVARQTARSRFGAFLLGGFGALALLLAALGVYGVLGYNVARRVREIGVRMALGARRGEVLRLILAEALTLTAAGVALGLLGAAALPRVLGGQLYGLSATDPATLAAAALVLAAAALVAGWLPARRATRVDPVVVLKGE
jgi:predicted permease